MTSKRVLKNGRWQYRVHWRNPAKTTGNPYTMSYFPTRQAADDSISRLESDREQFGSQWQEIGTMDRVEAVAALQAAREAGVSLRDAVQQAAARRGAPAPTTVVEIFNACLESKRVQGIRPRSLRSLTATFRRFNREHGRQQASSVTPGVIERFLSGLGVAPRSRLGHLINLQTGFSHAVRNGSLERNPCTPVPRPVVEKGETSFRDTTFTAGGTLSPGHLYLWTLDVSTGNGGDGLPFSSSLSISAVPEPATAAVVVGAACLIFAVVRRRASTQI